MSAVLTKRGPVLEKMAEKFAQKLGRPKFVTTDGWLSRWKPRHQIMFKRTHGEMGSGDTQGADKWISMVLTQLLREYKPDDIYNADETGLYYRVTPDGFLCYAYQKLSGSKKAMDCITVLCCANMTGSDKAKLLVIGKNKKQHCFQHINLDTLPVTYLLHK